jgi:hypothetical protein
MSSAEEGPVTILDLAEFRRVATDADGSINLDAFIAVGLPMFGGCSVCAASIAAYNACPSRSGYLKCAEGCIGDDGYPTVEEANRALFPEEYEWRAPPGTGGPLGMSGLATEVVMNPEHAQAVRILAAIEKIASRGALSVAPTDMLHPCGWVARIDSSSGTGWRAESTQSARDALAHVIQEWCFDHGVEL